MMPLIQRSQDNARAALHDAGIVDMAKSLHNAGKDVPITGRGIIQNYEAKGGYQKEFDAHVEAGEHDQIESARIVDRWGKPYGKPQAIYNQIPSVLGGSFNFTYISGASLANNTSYTSSSISGNPNTFPDFGKFFAWVAIIKTVGANFFFTLGNATNTPDVPESTTVTGDHLLVTGRTGGSDSGTFRVTSTMDPANNSQAMADAIAGIFGGSGDLARAGGSVLPVASSQSVRCFASGGLFGYIDRVVSTRPGNLQWTWQWSAGEAVGTWAHFTVWGYSIFGQGNRYNARCTAWMIPKNISGGRQTFAKSGSKSARIRYGIQVRAPR